jgi:hypothetical protein
MQNHWRMVSEFTAETAEVKPTASQGDCSRAVQRATERVNIKKMHSNELYRCSRRSKG